MGWGGDVNLSNRARRKMKVKQSVFRSMDVLVGKVHG
jgi:hypothetical protein